MFSIWQPGGARDGPGKVPGQDGLRRGDSQGEWKHPVINLADSQTVHRRQAQSGAVGGDRPGDQATSQQAEGAPPLWSHLQERRVRHVLSVSLWRGRDRPVQPRPVQEPVGCHSQETLQPGHQDLQADTDLHQGREGVHVGPECTWGIQVVREGKVDSIWAILVRPLDKIREDSVTSLTVYASKFDINLLDILYCVLQSQKLLSFKSNYFFLSLYIRRQPYLNWKSLHSKESLRYYWAYHSTKIVLRNLNTFLQQM